MNNADYVSEQINIMKTSGIPLSETAWKTALLCVGWPYVYAARGQFCTPANRRAKYRDDHPTIKSKCRNFDGQGSCSGCQWFPSAKRVRMFDCRGFTYWVLKAVFDGWELMGAGATSQWNTESNWKAKGTVAGGVPADTLVCLFVQKDVKMEHTGFGLNNETVECSSGVQHFTTRNKKWTHWAIPAVVDGVIPGPVPPEPVPPEPVPEGYAIVTGKNVALREGPSTSCKVIVRVPTGTKVKISEPPDDWEYIQHDGKKGYMMKKYLKER